jgi:hypothetical protein
VLLSLLAQATQPTVEQARSIELLKTLEAWVYGLAGLIGLITAVLVPVLIVFKANFLKLWEKSDTNTTNIGTIAQATVEQNAKMQAAPDPILNPNPHTNAAVNAIAIDPTTPVSLPGAAGKDM